MIYKDEQRGFQVGKIYAVRDEQTIYHNDDTKTIIGEGTPVKIIRIEKESTALITAVTAYGDTFKFKQAFSPVWDKVLNKSILSPLSTLKQLLVKFSYKTEGAFVWFFVMLAGLFIAPIALEVVSPDYSIKTISLFLLIPAFFMMFAVDICTKYSDCIDEETNTVINLQNRKELKMLFNENFCEIFSATEEKEKKAAS